MASPQERRRGLTSKHNQPSVHNSSLVFGSLKVGIEIQVKARSLFVDVSASSTPSCWISIAFPSQGFSLSFFPSFFSFKEKEGKNSPLTRVFSYFLAFKAVRILLVTKIY
jgi:hypothetical protein